MRFAVLMLAAAVLPAAFAQETLRLEIPTHYAPPELLRPAIQQVLSPQGRFVILADKGKVLVIDRPANLEAAAETIANLESPQPEIELSLGLRTGGKFQPANLRTLNPVQSHSSVAFPTAYDPPRILAGPNGTYAVIPAHPKNFQRRNLGVTLETEATVNPDGSVNVSMNRENVEFEGFINYGSPILTLGNAGVMPLLNQSPDPTFFSPFTTENKILAPVFSTTRISTSIVVFPELTDDLVRVNLLPQLNITEPEYNWVDHPIQLREFRTAIDLKNGELTPLRGFNGAPEAFNSHFFCGDDQPAGLTQIVLKAKVSPGKAPSTSE